MKRQALLLLIVLTAPHGALTLAGVEAQSVVDAIEMTPYAAIPLPGSGDLVEWDSQGLLWILSNQSLYTWDGSSSQLNPILTNDWKPIKHFEIAPGGEVLIVTEPGELFLRHADQSLESVGPSWGVEVAHFSADGSLYGYMTSDQFLLSETAGAQLADLDLSFVAQDFVIMNERPAIVFSDRPLRLVEYNYSSGSDTEHTTTSVYDGNLSIHPDQDTMAWLDLSTSFVVVDNLSIAGVGRQVPSPRRVEFIAGGDYLAILAAEQFSLFDIERRALYQSDVRGLEQFSSFVGRQVLNSLDWRSGWILALGGPEDVFLFDLDSDGVEGPDFIPSAIDSDRGPPPWGQIAMICGLLILLIPVAAFYQNRRPSRSSTETS